MGRRLLLVAELAAALANLPPSHRAQLLCDLDEQRDEDSGDTR